jgi:AraC-like DNA-binding protein
VQHVRTAIIEAFSRQECSMAAVAKRLGTSPRTLNRRLAEEGVGFKRLLEEIRRHLAQEYLADRRLSIGEIAFILGYGDVTAFHHAFRRWTKLTPAQFRERALPS